MALYILTLKMETNLLITLLLTLISMLNLIYLQIKDNCIASLSIYVSITVIVIASKLQINNHLYVYIATNWSHITSKGVGPPPGLL